MTFHKDVFMARYFKPDKLPRTGNDTAGGWGGLGYVNRDLKMVF